MQPFELARTRLQIQDFRGFHYGYIHEHVEDDDEEEEGEIEDIPIGMDAMHDEETDPSSILSQDELLFQQGNGYRVTPSISISQKPYCGVLDVWIRVIREEGIVKKYNRLQSLKSGKSSRNASQESLPNLFGTPADSSNSLVVSSSNSSSLSSSSSLDSLPRTRSSSVVSVSEKSSMTTVKQTKSQRYWRGFKSLFRGFWPTFYSKLITEYGGVGQGFVTEMFGERSRGVVGRYLY